MSRIKVMMVLAITALGSTMMHGQLPLRTWVSGLGDDVNPCSRANPCKTFAGAISKTAPTGEIDALDPGSFGTLAITKSITIDGGGGQVAAISSPGFGIIVNAQPDDVVVIRNLRLNGHRTGPAQQGIEFVSGKSLSLENVYVANFGMCIFSSASSASLHILNSVVENCESLGISAFSFPMPFTMTIDNSAILSTVVGIGSSGNVQTSVNRSVIEHASGTGIATSGGAASTIDHCDVSLNATAVAVDDSNSANFIADSKVAFNAIAFQQAAGSKNFTFHTNRVHSNGSLGATPAPLVER